MRQKATWITAMLTAMVLSASAALTQPEVKMDAAARTHAIEAVLRRLTDGYVFPDVARKMARTVREHAARKAYDSITTGEELAAVLTRDLRAVSNDRHIRVNYSAAVLPPEPSPSLSPTPEQREEARRTRARENFGLSKLDILPGNVGFLQFRYLAPPELAGDTYSAAMNYLANTDALIIDLRTCGGSISEDAIPMLCSYFFAEPTHLNDLYWRAGNKTRQLWTWAHVPGKRFLNKPIYLLTSRSTFSGAEELAYDLKNLKRATVVGETTGGGANPGGTQRANDHFSVWVPAGRAINPITKTNWEGVGVAPDVPVSASRALHTAHQAVLKQLIAGAAEEGWRNVLKRALGNVERQAAHFKKVAFSLPGYPGAREVRIAGSFNNWNAEANPLSRKGGAWGVEVETLPGRISYKFIVDGQWILDPANPDTEQDGEYVNSVRVVEP